MNACMLLYIIGIDEIKYTPIQSENAAKLLSLRSLAIIATCHIIIYAIVE